MGLGKQQRRIAIDPREKRNAGDLSGEDSSFIGASEVIALTSEGVLTVTLKSDGGLQNVSAELAIKLNGTTLELSTDGLSISNSFLDSINALLESSSSDMTTRQMLGDDQTLECAMIAQAMGMYSNA